MSEPEEDLETSEEKSKYYGSLERQIDEVEATVTGDNKSLLLSENIHISNEYMELDEPEMLDEKRKMLEEFERKKRARLITVPTDDVEVQSLLRDHGEPICLFGEGPADRRNRLKDFLSRKDDIKKGEAEILHTNRKGGKVRAEKLVASRREETWYHRGPPSLKEARMFIVNYSVPRARARLKKERLEKGASDSARKARKQELQNKLRSFGLCGSQNADSRPISFCSFSPNGSMLATSSWSGIAKIWKVADCGEELLLRGHTAYIDCIAWHPGATLTVDPHSLNLVSSSRDGVVNLWSMKSSDPIGSLPKLEGRVSRVQFHPSGRFIGTCVHDNSWRLWDLQVQEEVLFQEGHSKAVYCLKFQKDGSLAATGGVDCFGRVWDLRTGRCIMFLSGHTGSVLSLDWSPNGYNLVTGGEDNSARIWDVRARNCVYNIPAHNSIISGTAYDPTIGMYLVTTSYDGSVKLWCHGSFQLLKSLLGHGQKVMGVDVAPDSNLIATCSYDRTFKLWGPD